MQPRRGRNRGYGLTMLIFAAVAVAAGAAPALSQSLKFGPAEFHPSIEVRNRGDLSLNQYCAGWLYGVEVNDSRSPLIYRMDKRGVVDRIDFTIPESGVIGVEALACGSDGTIALSGVVYANDGRATTFLARIPPDRKQSTVTRIWPYVARRLTVAEDGTIWAAGWVKGKDDGIQEANVVRRFDSSGRLLGTVAVGGRPGAGPRRAPNDSNGDVVTGSLLRAWHDRVAWITGIGEYFEFSLDGRQLYHGEGPPAPGPDGVRVHSFAFSPTGRAVIGVSNYDGNTFNPWVLDRERRSWNPVTFAGRPSTWGHVLGFDGNALVLLENQLKVRIYPSEASPKPENK